ncbi:MAG: alpha/beta hydrolase [Leptolyngbyaceae cyanobacterium bins.59]|nr:alpha/beta hydrolase [Leptolyngbyaceae cyanobacterium bins.59]
MSNIKSQICFLTPKRLQPDYPLFVFLPGMDGTGQLLRSQTVGLECDFDVRCLAIPPDDLTAWDELTENVLALVEAEITGRKSKLPVYLCGESFGGCLALKVIQRAPQLFDRLILINPASSFNRKPFLRFGSQLVQWVPEPLYKLGSVGFLPFLAALERMTPSDRRELLKVTQTVPERTSIWRMSLLREFCVTEAALRRITQPTLLIASARDRLLPSLEEAHYLIEYLPNARLVVLPDSGHACLVECDTHLYRIMQEHGFFHESVSIAS